MGSKYAIHNGKKYLKSEESQRNETRAVRYLRNYFPCNDWNKDDKEAKALAQLFDNRETYARK